MSKIQHVPPSSLSHLPSRITYMQSFLAFHPTTDGPLVTSLKPLLAPLLPTLLDAVYTQLLSYDITARSFLPSQTSATANPGIDEKDVSALHLDHTNIRHRQDFLRAYLIRLLNNSDWSPESRFWEYMNNVGLVHTGEKHVSRGNTLRVEYAHIAMLLAWLQDAIVGVVMGVKAEEDGKTEWTLERKVEVLRALGKFWWMQNDLFARHYCDDWDLRGEKGNTNSRLGGSAAQTVMIGAVGAVTGALFVGCFLT